ncbi:MAG: thioredoxin domain-containing protein [Chitinophagaceae bacterium]
MLYTSFNSGQDHFTGNDFAPIELIQYGDLHCPACAQVYPEIKLLQDVMGRELRFVFRHFPQLHKNPLSLEAALATEAAAVQDKFWYMHDIIFENQAILSRPAFLQFAEDIGINLQRFESDREDNRLFRKVISDFENGVKSNIGTTPVFFFNGHRYNGKPDFSHLYKTCRFLLSLEPLNVNRA